MKAITCRKYGDPSKLQLEDLPTPSPKEGEVLIKVHASAINDFDWSLVRGKPIIYRLIFGLFRPKHIIPGIELAGTVEALGPNTSKFEVGDKVYGDISAIGWGTFASYCSVPETTMTKMTDKMSFQQAAAIPHASMLAYQGLVEVGRIKNGQNILINGAGGGMGTFGLQIAKTFNCEVTGVDTGEKLSKMKEIGFDHVLDYRETDFTKQNVQYDLILDAKSTRSPQNISKALKPEGIYSTVGGNLSKLIQTYWAQKKVQSKFNVVALKQNKQLQEINELFDEGKIAPVIDGPYSMEDIPELINYFGAGKHSGKVVIDVD